MPAYPATHPAVVVPAKRMPLAILDVPTEAPAAGEVVVNVKWASSSPFDLHQADGGLLSQPNLIPGTGFAGVVVSLGAESTEPKSESEPAPLAIGDQVFGFTWEKQKQAAFQTYVTVPARMLGRVPPNVTMEEAVTVPANLVTAIHTATHDLELELPWPKPHDWTPPNATSPILIWGGSSSVGLFSIQILHYWGFKNIIAVASEKHHADLTALGAKACFDYRDPDVIDRINEYASFIPSIVDCIGHLDGALRPISHIAKSQSKVAVMMPAIIQDSTAELEPRYSMDATELLRGEWEDGVKISSVRTFFYEQNEFLKARLQADIMPELLRSGSIRPNRQLLVQGNTLLSRAQKALDMLREHAPSGEKLVWRVAEE